MTGEYQERCREVQSEMAAAGVDFLLVAPSSDLLYLAGVDLEPSDRLAALLLPASGEPIVVAPRLEAGKLGGAASFASLAIWEDTDDPIGLVASVIRAGGVAHPTIAVGEQTWAGVLLRLQPALSGASFVPAGRLTAAARVVKSPAELRRLREAAAKVDEVYAGLIARPLAGKTEAEVAAIIVELMRGVGLPKVSFVIVASGPHSASPHHAPGERRLESGDVVVVDFGGPHRHYQSDITRTFCVGEPSAEVARVHAAVGRAQEAALRAVKPGVTAGEVDAVARRFLAEDGLADHFIHRTGHGLGLDVHEEPYLVAGSREVLREGMVFSVEPGVYLPGRFGVRIEDIVEVTATGAARLNRVTRKLVAVH